MNRGPIWADAVKIREKKFQLQLILSVLASNFTRFGVQGASEKRLDADVRGQIYAFVASSGQQSDYDTIKNIYLSVRSWSPLLHDPILYSSSQMTIHSRLVGELRGQGA